MKKVLIKTDLKNIIPDNFTQFSLSESSIIISNIDNYIHVKSLIYLKIIFKWLLIVQWMFIVFYYYEIEIIPTHWNGIKIIYNFMHTKQNKY